MDRDKLEGAPFKGHAQGCRLVASGESGPTTCRDIRGVATGLRVGLAGVWLRLNPNGALSGDRDGIRRGGWSQSPPASL